MTFMWPTYARVLANDIQHKGLGKVHYRVINVILFGELVIGIWFNSPSIHGVRFFLIKIVYLQRNRWIYNDNKGLNEVVKSKVALTDKDRQQFFYHVYQIMGLSSTVTMFHYTLWSAIHRRWQKSNYSR